MSTTWLRGAHPPFPLSNRVLRQFGREIDTRIFALSLRISSPKTRLPLKAWLKASRTANVEVLLGVF